MMHTRFPAPQGLSVPAPAEPRPLLSDADLYISPAGNDADPGTAERPLATLTAARDRLRQMHASCPEKVLTCAVAAGTYAVRGLSFGPEDSHTAWRARGDGEVILDGGLELPESVRVPLTDGDKERLHGDLSRVVKYDMKAAGLTARDWDILYPVGNFSTHERYDNAPSGRAVEVFSAHRRMRPARWPNEGTELKLAGVMDQGQPHEFPPQNYLHRYDALRNPRPGAYVLSFDDNEHVKAWKSWKDVWMFGRFYWDWADASTPVDAYEEDIRLVRPRYVARYGAREGQPFYFYNVFEELDEPGEYYMDRENGFLYAIPFEEGPLSLALTAAPIVQAEGVTGLSLDGFTLRGSRDSGVTLDGTGCVLENLFVTDVSGWGLEVSGTGNTVRCCEVTHTGEGGIRLSGGEPDTLTPGGNVAEDCFIHDWSEIFRTYRGGLELNGVGNIARHNELTGTGHLALYYKGNEHLFEYNFIHDTVRHAKDAGAIYSGQSWLDRGTVLRYNCLLDTLGDEENDPIAAIYWDDCLSGQTAYGNLIVNAARLGFLSGGGRDDRFFGNMIVNAGEAAWQYDDRGRDGALHGGWAHTTYEDPQSGAWLQLKDPRLQLPAWKEKYPQYAEYTDDFTRPDEPGFAVNPTGAEITGNLVIAPGTAREILPESVRTFGSVCRNALFDTPEAAGLPGIMSGDYSLPAGSAASAALPGFTELPMGMMGRRKERR